jgi:prepilin-type N-terminal cleavage/methylation domain-containing protein
LKLETGNWKLETRTVEGPPGVPLLPRTASRRAPFRRAGFTLMELLVVMAIMLTISTILVAGYFGMTRAASYAAAETDVYNLIQLARQRACLDGTKVFFMLIDSNSYVLVHGVGELTRDMENKSFNGRHRIYDAYADHFVITNASSKLCVWNMDRNVYADDVNINLVEDGGSDTYPGSGEKYTRMINTLDVVLPQPADYRSWKQGDRYGFELYPRQILPKGFYFGIQDIGTFPKNDKIVFAADGSSSRVSDNVTTTTGITKLYMYEKIAKETSRAVLIEITNPQAAIEIKKP